MKFYYNTVQNCRKSSLTDYTVVWITSCERKLMMRVIGKNSEYKATNKTTVSFMVFLYVNFPRIIVRRIASDFFFMRVSVNGSKCTKKMQNLSIPIFHKASILSILNVGI